MRRISNTRDLVYRIVRCIAPTIAGGKPATVMNISNDNGGLLDVWDRSKADIFTGSEIDYYELKSTDKNVIVIFFNRSQLNRLLARMPVQKFLSDCGYETDSTGSLDYVLSVLRQRYAAGCPHEIGIFLGIPLKDVKGFMGLNSLKNTKRGIWQVYGNPKASEKRMNEYRHAKDMVAGRLFAGENPINIIRDSEIRFFELS